MTVLLKMKCVYLVLIVILACCCTQTALAWQACNADDAGQEGASSGGLCPTGDTCCSTSTPGVSTCISGKTRLDELGSCCLDDDDDGNLFATTACGQGYACAKDQVSSYRYCHKMAFPPNATLSSQEQQHGDHSMDPPQLPRYRLCSVPEKVSKELYGFPVQPVITEQQQEEASSSTRKPLPLFAYYSTMGPIDSTVVDIQTKLAMVEKVVVVIHGSSRNADDYLCCMNSALPPAPGRTYNHPDPTNGTILVISPWFLAPDDLPVNITTTDPNTATVAEPLVWADKGPIYHTWRYGADAMNASVSAYAAVDAMVDYIVTATSNSSLDDDDKRFANLRDIIVIGHSAGGQYTQRWALLSNSTAFADHTSMTTPSSTTTSTSTDPGTTSTGVYKQPPSIRVIVANPKGFAYLDPRRYMEEYNHATNETRLVFGIPDAVTIQACRGYDEWEWGLSKTLASHEKFFPAHRKDFLPTPYKDRAIANAALAAQAAGIVGNATYEAGVDYIVQRYGYQRRLIYLAGQLDVLPNGEWCMEQIQGSYRRQRSFRFMKSLSEIFDVEHGKKHIHHRLVVAGVHHDHCLIFQSPEGQQAMFGNNFFDDNENEDIMNE